MVFLSSVVCHAQQASIIAHRGAKSFAPENTLIAFQKAKDMGVCFIELDVRLSNDDSLMIIHDEFLNRTTNGEGSIHDWTYEELRTLDAGSWFRSESSKPGKK